MAPKRTAKKSHYKPKASSKPGARLIGNKRGQAKGGPPSRQPRVAPPVIPGRRGPVETLTEPLEITDPTLPDPDEPPSGVPV